MTKVRFPFWIVVDRLPETGPTGFALRRTVGRRLEAIVSRIVAKLTKAGCHYRVSTELVTPVSGLRRVHVWAIAPCRIHMAAKGRGHPTPPWGGKSDPSP